MSKDEQRTRPVLRVTEAVLQHVEDVEADVTRHGEEGEAVEEGVGDEREGAQQGPGAEGGAALWVAPAPQAPAPR